MGGLLAVDQRHQYEEYSNDKLHFNIKSVQIIFINLIKKLRFICTHSSYCNNFFLSNANLIKYSTSFSGDTSRSFIFCYIFFTFLIVFVYLYYYIAWSFSLYSCYSYSWTDTADWFLSRVCLDWFFEFMLIFELLWNGIYWLIFLLIFLRVS